MAGTMDEQVPSLGETRAAFLATLAGKSPHTLHTYRTGLDRFADYLAERQIPPTTLPTALPRDVLERFSTWLVGEYGRASRPTCLTYVAAARAFFRFLERRGWGPHAAPFEQLQAGLREVLGRGPTKAPRTDPPLRRPCLAPDKGALPAAAPGAPTRRPQGRRDPP